MDMYKAISDLVTVNGVTGHETAVSGVVEEYFRRFTDDVWHDVSGNTFARIGNRQAGCYGHCSYGRDRNDGNGY